MPEIYTAILGAIGGATVTLWGLFRSLEKRLISRLQADLELVAEKYRTQLKKSEFIFEKKFSAMHALGAYVEELKPPVTHQDMTWHDVLESIAANFTSMEKWVKAFILQHHAVLPQKIINQLYVAAVMAGEGKLELDTTITPPEPKGRAFEAADQAHKALLNAYESLKGELLGESQVERKDARWSLTK